MCLRAEPNARDSRRSLRGIQNRKNRHPGAEKAANGFMHAMQLDMQQQGVRLVVKVCYRSTAMPACGTVNELAAALFFCNLTFDIIESNYRSSPKLDHPDMLE